MSNIMINNMLADLAPGGRPDPKAQVDPGNEDNFSHYLDQKVRSERRDRGNLLGVRKRVEEPRDRVAEPAKDTEQSPDTAAAFLQQLLVDLQDLAEKPDVDAGQWSFQLKSMAQLENMAEQAGMNPAELAPLKKQMESDGVVNLADIFAVFQQHFQDLQQPQEVTAPETDLPMLESLLSRMGVDSDALAKLSEQSINGQGEFDLASYLRGLQQLSDDTSLSLKPIDMSDLEQEQIQDMLATAGVSQGQIVKMFPAKIAAWQRALAGMPPVVEDKNSPPQMNLSDLKEFLSQGLADVENSRPKVDLPNFLRDLSDMLGQAGFVKQGVGWTPVVQESFTNVYQELQKMVDLAKVQVNKVSEMMSIDQELVDQWQNSANKLVETKMIPGESAVNLMAVADDGADEVPEVNSLQKQNDLATIGGEAGMMSNPDLGQIGRSGQEFRMPAVSGPNSMPILQQFAFDQLSQGVVQGLQRDEHHLTLVMYPKELGEVKVDLQIRNNQVAVSFVMDNHKVKEALEKNMDEFKENLNRQGYVLEACAVLIDERRNNAGDGRGQFQEDWKQLLVDGAAGRKTGTGVLEDSVEQIMATAQQGGRWPDSSISVLV